MQHDLSPEEQTGSQSTQTICQIPPSFAHQRMSPLEPWSGETPRPTGSQHAEAFQPHAAVQSTTNATAIPPEPSYAAPGLPKPVAPPSAPKTLDPRLARLQTQTPVAPTTTASRAIQGDIYTPQLSARILTQAGAKRDASQVIVGDASKKIKLGGESFDGLRLSRKPVCSHCQKLGLLRCDGRSSCTNCSLFRQVCIYEACARGAGCLTLGCQYLHEGQWTQTDMPAWNIKVSTSPSGHMAAFGMPESRKTPAQTSGDKLESNTIPVCCKWPL